MESLSREKEPARTRTTQRNFQQKNVQEKIREKNREKTGTKRSTIWMILPLYLFTLVFVACPLL